MRKPTLFRVLLLTTGLTIMIVAFLANQIGLSNTETISKGKILLFSVGIILLFLGMVTRKEDFQNIHTFSIRIENLYKGSAILLLNIIGLFLILESGATLFFKVISIHEEATKSFGYGAYYDSQVWATDYWYEHSIIVDQGQSTRYSPYVIWRRVPFNGKTININQDGIRSTPGSNCNSGSYKVFFFGGSSMWGFGAPDWGTIPAYLQYDLGEVINKPICTVNYGEIGYVSTQELIKLILQLQAGNSPDLVIFYDGVNDTQSAYDSGQAGSHYDLEQIAAKIEGRDANPILNWLQSSASFTLFKYFIARITPNQIVDKLKGVNNISKGIDLEKLSDSVVQVYLDNYEIVDSLSHKYGFKYLFFWQPVLSIGNKVLNDDELVFKSSMSLDQSNFYDLVYHKVKSIIEIHNNLYYLDNVFDQQTGQIWIDFVHINPVGNQLVAHKMLEAIKPLLVNH